MVEYYFLFVLGLVWVVFATIQDLKTREVANWLNFSLIAFALAYRFFYADYSGDWSFFWFGVLGLMVFVGLAFAFYYGRVFAGGDAKLLMGLGAVLPFESYWSLVFIGGTFIVLLFLAGLIYTLIYSVFVVVPKRRKFWKGFVLKVRGSGVLFLSAFAFSLLSGLMLGFVFSIGVFVLLCGLVFLYGYVKVVDKLMIREVNARDLREGDWLEKSVKVRDKIIKKSVHGLSLEDIKVLRKAKKKVWVKEGVPFTPAFLAAYIVMVYAVSILSVNFVAMISSLLQAFS